MLVNCVAESSLVISYTPSTVNRQQAFFAVQLSLCWDCAVRSCLCLQPGEEPCGVDPYVALPDRSKYVDQQTLKLQERPEVRKWTQGLSMPTSKVISNVHQIAEEGLSFNSFAES